MSAIENCINEIMYPKGKTNIVKEVPKIVVDNKPVLKIEHKEIQATDDTNSPSKLLKIINCKTADINITP
jgi:hypothetical protein